jgi:hypothetical protein
MNKMDIEKQIKENGGTHETIRDIIEDIYEIDDELCSYGEKMCALEKEKGELRERIDDVFEYIAQNYPAEYNDMKVIGHNAYRLRFVSDNILYVIEQNKGYNKGNSLRININIENITVL